jgi:uncharacterized protein
VQLELTRYRQPLDRFERTFSPDEVGDEGDPYRIVAPVHLVFEIHKDKDTFRLVGNVDTELELACSRCLESYRFPMSAAFDLRYLPASSAVVAEGEHEMDEEQLEISYYRDDQIDLNELLCEQFYLALPMKPLCREDCGGLCPQCGTNLNTSTCGCAPTWDDPRFAVLKGLGRTRES